MALKKTAAFCVGFEQLKNLTEKQIRKSFGGKALGLYQAWLLDIAVPPSLFFPIEHYETFIAAHSHHESNTFKQNAISWIIDQFGAELALLPNHLFAVRSSSQYEDAFEHSFAGIFESQLNIKKTEIPEAIAAVWDSCFSLRVSSYVELHADLRMGVILQPMVEAKYSGVAFSKHPSPSNVHENQNLVIEFAPLSADKVVQGEITPFRLSGTLESLSTAADSTWMDPLLSALLKLKNSYRHEVDIEFVVDRKETFWLVQQRPISVIHGSHVLDLSFYTRKYKRALFCFDCELLIEGCSLFLAPYLEIPYQMDRWMVMVTAEDGVQELWVHTLLDHAVLSKICQKIEEDPTYLPRITQRYDLHYQRILQFDYSSFADPSVPLQRRFFSFCEFILPLQAHYYVPMFMLDALHALLKRDMEKIDPLKAEDDLFKMGTWQIASLMEILYEELRDIRKHYKTLPDALTALDQQKLKKIARLYGFLKCRSLDEAGYTVDELFTLLKQIPEKSTVNGSEYENLRKKYLTNSKTDALFERFREWMRIRNQEMEFLMYALNQSRTLFEEICTYLSVSLKALWKSSKEVISQALKQGDPSIIKQFSSDKLVIYRCYGKTRINNTLQVTRASQEKLCVLKGKTVYGSGKLQAKVKIVFSIKELMSFNDKEKPILVTGMTTPDFIPYLKKHFSALITDEGGILCHAAIVAREIPIPCIVGTSFATEALTDGTYVTIDFDKGEIFL